VSTAPHVRRYAPPLALALVTLAFIALSYGYSPASRWVPLIVGYTTLALVALDLLSRSETRAGRIALRYLNPSCAEATGESAEAVRLRDELTAIGWIAAFTFAVLVVGFLVAMPLYMFLFMLLQGRFGLVKSAVTAVVFPLGIWITFEVVLRYEIYRGLLFA
jgi:hypothetical protein